MYQIGYIVKGSYERVLRGTAREPSGCCMEISEGDHLGTRVVRGTIRVLWGIMTCTIGLPWGITRRGSRVLKR